MNAATDREIADRLGRLDTPAVSDALDALGIHGQCVGLLPVGAELTSHHGPMVGRAFTVRMLPVGESGRSVGDYIDDVPAGAVVVIDNLGRLDTTVWGDLLTATAVRNGVAGVVIDGVCRDSGGIVETGLPVFARSRTMRTGKDRVAAESYEVAVQAATVRVDPGDWLLGDRDGVLVVPAGRCAEVLAKAEEIDAAEDRIRVRLRSGDRLDEARRTAGYHRLQAPAGSTS
ncbi:MAG: RraA family protein [Pseudonocardia sp.]|uniref:RraA family protein n=1 Tax=unclassified Pseudonocardia TaxID=2619320 RepID=UPI0008697307|nr:MULTISPECIES: RraA family protein [unclassified Pseudonocardia]MBN9110463.1 RraA family protein [Pseudonocardia sp.]ODU29784.1 MAG: diguanylate cyclase [Pseudonocardia sp. SCN 72-51]ODV03457.1 MAG: diguanylate cyclase [Pseudonocardia sp. SCN 73-27]